MGHERGFTVKCEEPRSWLSLNIYLNIIIVTAYTNIKLIISRINLDISSKKAKKGQKRAYPKFQKIITFSPCTLSPKCKFWHRYKLWDIFGRGTKALLHKKHNLHKFKMAAIKFVNYHIMPYNFGTNKDRKIIRIELAALCNHGYNDNKGIICINPYLSKQPS